MTESKSEIARLRQQVELECEAAKQGLSGTAVTARHDFIMKRYANLGKCEEELAKHLGRDAAHVMVIEIYQKVMS